MLKHTIPTDYYKKRLNFQNITFKRFAFTLIWQRSMTELLNWISTNLLRIFWWLSWEVPKYTQCNFFYISTYKLLKIVCMPFCFTFIKIYLVIVTSWCKFPKIHFLPASRFQLLSKLVNCFNGSLWRFSNTDFCVCFRKTWTISTKKTLLSSQQISSASI